MKKAAFTLIELIFVIVIIGVLASMAVPRFSGLSANSKIAAELATASTVQAAIDDAHSEWIMSEGSFQWGNGKSVDCSGSTSVIDNFNCGTGYPDQLGTNSKPFEYILKKSPRDWELSSSDNKYRGPASKTDSGVTKSSDVAGKPDNNDYWEYNSTNGTFKLIDN